MNLPNRITLLRTLLAPVCAALLLIDAPATQMAGAAVFILAALTDMVDGMIARRTNQVTDFGKLIDPIADKLIVMVVMVALVSQGRIHPVVVMISLGREFVISGMRIVAAAKGIVIAADAWGKVKTVIQMIALPTLILCTGAHYVVLDFLYWPGQVMLWASAALSVYSLIGYILKNREVFSE